MKLVSRVRLFTGTAALAMSSLSLVGVAKADTVGGPFSSDNTIAPTATDLTTASTIDIYSLGNHIFNIILSLATIVAVFYLIYSGVQYITANGSPDKIKTARSGIINSIIGIVIIVLAFFIIKFAIGVAQTINTNVQGGS